MFPNKCFSDFHLKYDNSVFPLENMVGFCKLLAFDTSFQNIPCGKD